MKIATGGRLSLPQGQPLPPWENFGTGEKFWNGTGTELERNGTGCGATETNGTELELERFQNGSGTVQERVNGTQNTALGWQEL